MTNPFLTTFKFFLSVTFLSLVITGCDDSDHGAPRAPEPSPEPPIEPEPDPPAPAREVTDTAELLSGPLARGAVGDFILENDELRVIIQRPGRRWFGIGTYGGNIIDVSAKKADESFYPDHMEAFVTGVNIENTPNYTEVRIVNEGLDGEAGEICASGPDDLLDYLNASSALRDAGFQFPDSADDRDLPLEIETCYRLAPGDRYVTMDTTLRNTDADDLEIYMAEYLNGSGQVEAFQPLVGFGEPLISPTCPDAKLVACSSAEDGLCDQCNYVAFSGVDGAAGVSYGLIHEAPGSSSFSRDGANVLLLGHALLDLLTGQALPNYTIPGDGELTLRSYFAVGDGTVSSIADIRNEIFGIETGELNGRVTSAGEPLAGAQVAIYQVINDQIDPPSLFMAGHVHTDSDGAYHLSLPPGDYEAWANMEGHLFDDDGPAAVSISVDGTASQDFVLPAPGYLEVTVIDENGGVPAKLQLVGFDPSPPLKNAVMFSQAGVFGDVDADALPFGITAVDLIDRSGISRRMTVEPGDYQLLVSRGPRYSAYRELITISSGQTTTIQAEIARVIDDVGFVHGDFHVHTIDSPDAEVTREERVATLLAEGMDFFTPSEHDKRVDFSATLTTMGVEDLVGTASNAETTTFDYGHFNSWPVTVDPNRVEGGAVDWAREAQPGMDFPEYGSYSLSPREIYQALLDDPKDNVVQINHVYSHFSPAGLAVDTGLVPPQSTVDVTIRRLDPSLTNAFDDGFDSLEVWIGTNGRSGIFGDFLGRNAGDWFNLINQGIIRTGIANSDSHQRRFTRISARNLVASDVTDPGELSSIAEQLAANVRNGKSVGTNVPFVTIDADGLFEGTPQHAGLRHDDSTDMPVDSGSDVTVTVNVATPAWAQLDTVEFYINSQTELTSIPGAAASYGICADAVVQRGDPGWIETQTEVVPGLDGASRTDITATLTLPGLEQDSWIVAIVKGSDGVSEPLFPVLPASLNEDSNETLEDLIDGNLGEEGTPAFAFTNPLFVDVDNDGWTAPGVATADCTAP